MLLYERKGSIYRIKKEIRRIYIYSFLVSLSSINCFNVFFSISDSSMQSLQGDKQKPVSTNPSEIQGVPCTNQSRTPAGEKVQICILQCIMYTFWTTMYKVHICTQFTVSVHEQVYAQYTLCIYIYAAMQLVHFTVHSVH